MREFNVLNSGDKAVATKLDRMDHAINILQGILKGIPYVGPSLEHFICGPLLDLRLGRIEQTLREIADGLGSKVDPEQLSKEEFVNLLESVGPALSRETDETKRKMFRDLLTKAAALPSGSSDWREAEFASSLLKSLEPAALVVLAAIARCRSRNEGVTITKEGRVFEGEPNNRQEERYSLPFEWVVVEEWIWRLKEM